MYATASPVTAEALGSAKLGLLLWPLRIYVQGSPPQHLLGAEISLGRRMQYAGRFEVRSSRLRRAMIQLAPRGH